MVVFQLALDEIGLMSRNPERDVGRSWVVRARSPSLVTPQLTTKRPGATAAGVAGIRVDQRCRRALVNSRREFLSSDSYTSTVSSFVPCVQKPLVFLQKASEGTSGNITKTNSLVNSEQD